MKPDATAEAPSLPLLENYHPAVDAYDEMLLPDGRLRRPWQGLIGAFGRSSGEELATRHELTRRILREHGATYNIYADGQGLGRPWSLDLVPMVLTAEEWHQIEVGLMQRAHLLNQVLLDIYGPQRLLEQGLLPPALLHANPAFLRACHGVRPARDFHLFLHAVDLARSPDGQWWALADRTQAPSGAGYALENRLVLSRVLPDEFRDAHVQRPQGFFQAVREALVGLARRGTDNPRVVLLTPGPYNETYFEQVFLARYLGLPLVEGADLTVRDRRVFIKTLEGLQPVNVILRRMDDLFCDPLELRADSSLGVPGLVEAARAGNVAVANALGSGAVEMPALLAFLPALSRHLLSEELKLPSVATWWCGQEREFAQVRERLDDLVIKRAFAPAATAPLFPAALDEGARSGLLEEMGINPFEFVGQERVRLSSVPVWEGGRFQPRPCVLRAFICATESGYAVMPGALTRFSTSPDRLVVSMQSGGGSKDTWVLGDGPIAPTPTQRSSGQVIRLERAAAELPSRVADNLFWFGRYTERLEDILRLLRCVLGRLAGEAGAEDSPELRGLIHLLAALDVFPARFQQRYTLAGVEREVQMLVFQTHRLGTVREITGRLRNLAFLLRDRFSADTWSILERVQVDSGVRTKPGLQNTLAMLNQFIRTLAAFSGMEMENMTRGHGWRFLEIGRRLERAANITTLIQGAVAPGLEDTVVLEPVLEIADSTITYRRRYFALPLWPGVLDLLLVDETNPRSLAFQVNELLDHTAHLPPAAAGSAGPQAASQAAALRALVSEAERQFAGGLTDAAGVVDLLQEGVTRLRGLSDTVTHLYFNHTDARVS